MLISNGVKKVFGIALGVGMMLAAGSALAATQYKTTSMMGGTVQFESSPLQMQGYMDKLKTGSLSSDEQKAMFQVMQPQGGQNVLYFNKAVQPPMMAWNTDGGNRAFFREEGINGRAMVWMQLMSVISVALIWVVLLLGIALMWKHLRKHHN